MLNDSKMNHKIMFMVCEAHKVKESLDYFNLFSNSMSFSFSYEFWSKSLREIDNFPHDSIFSFLIFRVRFSIMSVCFDCLSTEECSNNGAVKWSIIMLHFNVLLIDF